MGEFDLISHYFNIQQNPCRDDVNLAIGDDCALLTCPVHQQIAITTDTMVEGTHFFASISPDDLAYKVLATNLSDLAAMGAKPAWVSLALTLPYLDEIWLKTFSQTFFKILQQENITLIGGDTTKGERQVITITAQGLLPNGKALKRNCANAGDYIFVSGTLGDSAAGLAMLTQEDLQITFANKDYLIARHLRPTARIKLGMLLLEKNFSSCAIDISDGLLADLGHILERSHCSATLDLEKLPYSEALKQLYPCKQKEKLALTGGEDYELCFTVPEYHLTEFLNASQQPDFPAKVTCIGRITEKNAMKIMLQRNGNRMKDVLNLNDVKGYDHFAR